MKRLVYLGDEFKNVPFSALQSMAKHVQAEPDMTERMVKAVMKALYWIRANREGSIDIIMKNGRLMNATSPRRFMISCAMLMFPRSARRDCTSAPSLSSCCSRRNRISNPSNSSTIDSTRPG